jgi:GNAT superfamily N-acetyltransferase
MEHRRSIVKEYIGECGTDHRGVFQVVECGPLDADISLVLIWEAYYAVNREDLDTLEIVEVDGKPFPLHGVEKRYYDLLRKGIGIRVMLLDGIPIACLVYSKMADSIDYIRLLYTVPEYEGYGIGKALVDVDLPKQVIFKTRIENAPKKLKQMMKVCRMVCKNAHFELWLMNRELSNGTN